MTEIRSNFIGAVLVDVKSAKIYDEYYVTNNSNTNICLYIHGNYQHIAELHFPAIWVVNTILLFTHHIHM